MSTLDHPAIAMVAAALTKASQHPAAHGIRILPPTPEPSPRSPVPPEVSKPDPVFVEQHT